ncbi:hypothetical protein QO034_11535 [Sedimentitalea sp. JM2-8]|uniref:DUF3828 domain-containing protein n=1 Tax=Sedimentitalea xiamensis TaxID=3050037 RepID=A0ABT7FF48_9RHOB|nr:hypothetical protein [Sedimentitalea xiamensis]MDK3073746.1 hypothetical protein [Sedimentitalea xiamensis]
MRRQFGWLALLVWAVGAEAAMAQTPEEIVRWIYSSLALPPDGQAKGLHYLTVPERRGTYLSQRLVRLYDTDDLNSNFGDNLMNACFERGFEIPGNDMDAAEINRTLSLTTEADTTRQRITARFTNFGTPAQIHYDFIVEDGFWRINDIGYPGWALSGVTCDPRPAAAPAPAGETGYCYRSGSDEFRLYVAGDGSARFTLESWQGGGHSCSAAGTAQPVAGGWIYQEDFYGRLCRMEIRVTPEAGIRIADPDHDCKMSLCGQRAMLDGLAYARETQVDCASLPPPPQY